MNQKKVEQQSLIFTTFMNVIFAIAGLIIFIITDIQALFLDFFFSFIDKINFSEPSFVATLATIPDKSENGNLFAFASNFA